MTSPRTLIGGLVFAALLAGLAAWMLMKAAPVPGLAALFFAPAIPLAVWSVGAYKRKRWAWQAALAFVYVATAGCLAGVAALSVYFFGSWGLQAETVGIFVVCALVVTLGVVASAKEGIEYLRRSRSQFD